MTYKQLEHKIFNLVEGLHVVGMLRDQNISFLQKILVTGWLLIKDLQYMEKKMQFVVLDHQLRNLHKFTFILTVFHLLLTI